MEAVKNVPFQVQYTNNKIDHRSLSVLSTDVFKLSIRPILQINRLSANRKIRTAQKIPILLCLFCHKATLTGGTEIVVLQDLNIAEGLVTVRIMGVYRPLNSCTKRV